MHTIEQDTCIICTFIQRITMCPHGYHHTFIHIELLKRIVTNPSTCTSTSWPDILHCSIPFLVSLLCIKCMLPTIVSNKTLLLCIIRVLKEHTSFLMTTLKWSRPLLIKFSDMLALCCSPSMYEISCCRLFSTV